MRVFPKQAQSNAKMTVKLMYEHHEKKENAEYKLGIEKGCFTPITLFSCDLNTDHDIVGSLHSSAARASK